MIIGTLKDLFYDKSFLRFLIVGVINTTVGLSIMFSCYNLLHLGYWFSSAMDYLIGSIVSYFLNKHYTFGYHEKGWWSIIRFTINIIVCYLIAFSVARPLVRFCLSHIGFELSVSMIVNIAMLVGTGVFMVVNYLGQRFFTFYEKAIK